MRFLIGLTFILSIQANAGGYGWNSTAQFLWANSTTSCFSETQLEPAISEKVGLIKSLNSSEFLPGEVERYLDFVDGMIDKHYKVAVKMLIEDMHSWDIMRRPGVASNIDKALAIIQSRVTEKKLKPILVAEIVYQSLLVVRKKLKLNGRTGFYRAKEIVLGHWGENITGGTWSTLEELLGAKASVLLVDEPGFNLPKSYALIMMNEMYKNLTLSDEQKLRLGFFILKEVIPAWTGASQENYFGAIMTVVSNIPVRRSQQDIKETELEAVRVDLISDLREFAEMRFSEEGNKNGTYLSLILRALSQI